MAGGFGINPKTIIGDTSDPASVWLSMGRLIVIFGLAGFGGVHAFGVSIAQTTSMIAGGILIMGVLMMIFGTQKRENTIAEQRKNPRARFEPSARTERFVTECLKVGRTLAEIETLPYAPIDDMHETEAKKLLKQLSAKEGILTGPAVYHDGRFYDRAVLAGAQA